MSDDRHQPDVSQGTPVWVRFTVIALALFLVVAVVGGMFLY